MQDTVWLDEEQNCLKYIDQTKLPGELVIRSCCELRGLTEAIRRLEIRGAPAIGVGAAIGLYAAAYRFEEERRAGFLYSLAAAVSILLLLTQQKNTTAS